MSGQSASQQRMLAVAIPSYNGRALLEVLLPSLASQSIGGFRVIVVDDCSTDGSVEYLSSKWPAVELVQAQKRRGVTAAMNSCVSAALAHSDVDLVALLNNDTELSPNCLGELVSALDRDARAGSAAPKMLDFTDRNVVDGAGDLLSWRGGGTRRGHGEDDIGQYDAHEYVFGPCGGAAIYRRRAFEAVGGFDEDFFAYYEDLDWAFRAQLAGFRCIYVPSAVIYHRGSATLGRGITDFNGYHLWRNPIWMVVKCFPARSLLRHAPEIARGQLGNLWRAVRVGKTRVWVRAIRDALLGLPAALRKRRIIQAQRVVSIDYLEAIAMEQHTATQTRPGQGL